MADNKYPIGQDADLDKLVDKLMQRLDQYTQSTSRSGMAEDDADVYSSFKESLKQSTEGLRKLKEATSNSAKNLKDGQGAFGLVKGATDAFAESVGKLNPLLGLAVEGLGKFVGALGQANAWITKQAKSGVEAALSIYNKQSGIETRTLQRYNIEDLMGSFSTNNARYSYGTYFDSLDTLTSKGFTSTNNYLDFSLKDRADMLSQ